MKRGLIFIIHLYQKFISPLKGRPTCIYTPTCSQYAIEALEKYGFFKGTFVDNADFPELNAKFAEIGEKYGLSKTGVAAAWILRHPANMQLIAGTMNPDHLTDICKAADVTLTRSEWYEIYRAAGHCLP